MVLVLVLVLVLIYGDSDIAIRTIGFIIVVIDIIIVRLYITPVTAAIIAQQYPTENRIALHGHIASHPNPKTIKSKAPTRHRQNREHIIPSAMRQPYSINLYCVQITIKSK